MSMKWRRRAGAVLFIGGVLVCVASATVLGDAMGESTALALLPGVGSAISGWILLTDRRELPRRARPFDQEELV